MRLPHFATALHSLGLASLCLAAPLAAQDGPAQDQNADIVVEGARERDRAAQSQARSITPRDHVISAPIARFQDPVCAGVWGLGEESARLVIDRIMYNAERIGLEVDENEGCSANVIVGFVADPHEEFQGLRDVNHALVSGLDLSERKRVADQTGPAIAWNATMTRTADGQGRSGTTFDSTQIGRTQLGTREDIVASVVFIQRDAIANLDGVAVADYATMRALVKTLPPEEETAFGTVLSLFDQGNATAPDRLTPFDLAYLTSIYSGRANMPSRMALGNVGSLMEEVVVD